MKPIKVRFVDSLEMKFLKVTLPVVVITGTLLFGSLEGLSAMRAMDELSSMKTLLVRNYSILASDWVWNLDRDRVRLSLENLVRNKHVVGAYVVDDLGDEIASAGILTNGAGLTATSADIFFMTDSSQEMIGQTTLFVTDQVVWENFYEQLMKDGMQAFYILFMTIVVAIFASRRTVTLPLSRMMGVIDKAVGNDFPEPVDWNSRDEIGAVVQSFNRLMVRRKQAELEKNIMEQDLREAQKLEAVGQLAGGIAHEINTPCQYIGDNLKFLSDCHADIFLLLEKSLALSKAAGQHQALAPLAEEIGTLCEDIDIDYLRQEIPSATDQSVAGIGQVSRIVLAMKEFSHPGTKEMSLADINKALENTIIISRNEWKHVAEMATSLDGSLPAVSCLAGEINQVFLNLIVNAAHAIADDKERQGLGQINVSTETDGDNVIIRIADDGTGIPEAVCDNVFNPFFTTKAVGKGTGQGLSIARDIVANKHGGTICFDTKVGRGTTFTVKLPIRAVQPAQAFPHENSKHEVELETGP